MGEHRVKTKTASVVPGGSTGRTQTHTAHSFEWRPRLTAAEIPQLRAGWVMLIYNHGKAYCLRAPTAHHRRLFRRGLLPWPALAVKKME